VPIKLQTLGQAKQLQINALSHNQPINSVEELDVILQVLQLCTSSDSWGPIFEKSYDDFTKNL